MPTKISPLFAKELNASLRTERLAIEALTADHARVLFEPMQDHAIYQWISSSPPKSFESLEQWCRSRESRLDPKENDAWLNWTVRRLSDGAYVGKLDAEITALNVATNVGYLFFPSFWGRGFASEAVRALTDHFAANGITKMLATVTEGNEASYRVLEKAGFTRSRIIPDNDIIRGVKYNDVEFVRGI